MPAQPRQILAQLTRLTGEWQGQNQLWLSPDRPAEESPSGASIQAVAQGRFVQVRYTWAYQGKPQDGLLLVGAGAAGAIRAVWVDSWHMQDEMMHCAGTADSPAGSPGAIRLAGAYAAPPGPDWGWRIELELPEPQQAQPESFRLLMFNIHPDGTEDRAVEAVYRRAGASS